MYSFKQVFKQEPAGLVALLALINSVLISFDVYSMSDKQLSGCNALALALFTAFYIRPLTVTKDAMKELSSRD